MNKKIPVRSVYKMGSAVATPTGLVRLDPLTVRKLLDETRVEPEKDWQDENELIQSKAILALIGQVSNHSRQAEDPGWEMLAQAWRRQLAQADKEGVLWTPVMDILAEGMSRARESRRYAVRQGGELVEKMINKQMTKIGKMAQEASIEELREACQPFEYDDFWVEVFKNGREIKEEHLDIALTSPKAEKLTEAILKNKALDREMLIALAKKSFNLDRKGVMEIAKPENAWSSDERKINNSNRYVREGICTAVVENGGLEHIFKNEEYKGPLVEKDMVAEMCLASPTVAVEALEQIFKGDHGAELRKLAFLHPGARAKASIWLAGLTYTNQALIKLLIQDASTPAALVEQIARAWTPEYGEILGAMLIKDKRVGDKEALRIGREVEAHWVPRDKVGVRMALAARKMARTDKVIWDALSNTQHQDVLIEMVNKAQSTEELARAVKRLRRSSVRQLLYVLNKMDMPKGINLPQKLLAPILATGSPKEREEAIAVIGRWGQKKKMEERSKEGSKEQKKTEKRGQ